MLEQNRRSRVRLIAASILVAGLGLSGWLIAADHIDSPLVRDDAGADIADVYSFASPTNPDNIVLAMTLHGFVPPSENNISLFDPSVLYQFKIDNDGDAVEDLVIQGFATGKKRTKQRFHLRGPAAPLVTGTEARVLSRPKTGKVRVSATSDPIISIRDDITLFAGVRDDPFFFDFGQFTAILNGDAGSFNDPGTDSFAGFNVYAVVVELPRAMLGDGAVGVWGTTSRLP